MIAVIAPEPAAWLPHVLEAAQRAGPVVLFAPWALPENLVRRAPSFVAAPLRRRTISGVNVRALPGWSAFELALKAWSRSRTARIFESRFVLRRATDLFASRWLPAEATAVIAPSLAARRTFAVAAKRGLRTFLVEDLPDLRRLHEDLDFAFVRHPQARLLANFRASAQVVARQASERVLASTLLVTSRFARDERRREGRRDETILDLPGPLPDVRPIALLRPPGRTRRVLLAGPACARHGTFEALEAIRSRAIELLVRASDAMEPRDLLHHPQVRPASPAELETLTGVDAVVAPSWCEAHPPEVVLAAALGIPVVATKRAAGLVDLAQAGLEVRPGDVAGLSEALHRAFTLRPRPEEADDRAAALAAALGAEPPRPTRIPVTLFR